MRYLALLVFIISPALVNAQSSVTVLGSVHAPTKYITADTLLKAIQSYKPDIILMELDSSLMDEAGNFKRDPKQLSLESVVADAYRKANPSVRLDRIDVIYRNKFYKDHNTFAKESMMSKSIDSLYKGNKLNDTTWFTVNSLYSASQILNNYGYLQLKDINSRLCMQAASLRQTLLYRNEVNIIRNNEALKNWYPFAKENADFWDLRNDTMTANTIKCIKKNPGKKILLIVGYFHKYALIGRLTTLAQTNKFTIAENY